jgi:hypothetical protein
VIAILPNLKFGQLPVKRMILPQLARAPRMACEWSQCVGGLTGGMYLAPRQHLSTRSAWLPFRWLPESWLATTELHSPGDGVPQCHTSRPTSSESGDVAIVAQAPPHRSEIGFFLPSLALSNSTPRTTTHGSKRLRKLHEINDE